MENIESNVEQVQQEEQLYLQECLKRAYLEYAVSVVTSRALPKVRDGQKPVQRRILFDMLRMGITSSSKHIKVARVVGDTMGKYHPHGDKSIADAMIRMAQDFSLRYPLIDGQGNFGSRDGDGAAAPRYIEARLTGYADLLLGEIDKGTIDFIPNYEGSFLEPSVLPSRLPFVLLNGASGVAVGYATEIPSHNLGEVAKAVTLLINDRATTLDEIMNVLPGPDFPNGGQIISSRQQIYDAYKTGSGSIRMRARWKKEELARGQWRIVFYDMPHGVSSAKVSEDIESLTNPQIKANKKELTPDQKANKALFLSLIDVVRDEASKKEPVRLVIEPKTSKQSVEELISILYAHTSLEGNVSLNMTMLGNDDNPRCKGILEILNEWIDFRFETVARRLQSRLDDVEKRLHILAGRLIAFDHLMEVIEIIRNAEDAKSDLISTYSFSIEQAEDILEIKLRQLARLEGKKIESEISNLREESKKINFLLNDKAAFSDLILEEINTDSKKYSDDRRTVIIPSESTKISEVSTSDDPITIIMSKNGWVRSKAGHSIDRLSITYKLGDSECYVIEAKANQNLIILDSNGRSYTVKNLDLPTGRGDGVPISSLIDIQNGPNGAGKVCAVMSGDNSDRYLFSMSSGYGFISEIKNMVGRNKAGSKFMTIEAGDVILNPVLVDNSHIYAISSGAKDRRMLCFTSDLIKTLPGGKGVIIMKLNEDEKLDAIGFAGENSVEIVGDNGNSLRLKFEEIEKFKSNRASKGSKLTLKFIPVKIVK